MTYLHEPPGTEPQATFHVPGITNAPDTDPIRNLSELTQPRKDSSNLRKIDRVPVEALKDRAANQFAITRTLNNAIDNFQMPNTLRLGSRPQDINEEAAVLVMALSKLDPDPENPHSGYFKIDNQFVNEGIGAVLKYSGIADRKIWSNHAGVRMPGQVVDNVVKKIESLPGWTQAMPNQKVATIDAAVASLIGMGNVKGALEFITKVPQLMPDRPNAIGEAFKRAHTQGLFDYAIQIGGPKAEAILAAIAQKRIGDGLANIPEAQALSEEAKERIRTRLDQKESVFVEAQRVVPIEKRMGSITERVVQIANSVIDGALPPKDAYPKIQGLVRDLPDGIVANYLAGQIGLAINWDIGGDKEEMIQTLISSALAEETPSNNFRNINGFETLVPQATDLTPTERFDVRDRYNEQVYSNFPQSLDGPLMFTHLSQLIRNHSTYLFQIEKLLPKVPEVQRKKIVETYERLGLLLLDIADNPVMEGIFESQFGQSGFNRYRANTIIEGMDRSLGTHISDTTSGLLQTPHAHALREQRRERLDRFSRIEEAHNEAVSSRSNELEVAVPQAIHRADEEISAQEKANKAIDDARKQALAAIDHVESQILAKKSQVETEKAGRAGIMKFLKKPDQNRILALEKEIAALEADKSAKDKDFPAPVDPTARENLTRRRQRLTAFTQATQSAQGGSPQAKTVTHGG